MSFSEIYKVKFDRDSPCRCQPETRVDVESYAECCRIGMIEMALSPPPLSLAFRSIAICILSALQKNVRPRTKSLNDAMSVYGRVEAVPPAICSTDTDH